MFMGTAADNAVKDAGLLRTRGYCLLVVAGSMSCPRELAAVRVFSTS